ncbi:disulfide bond formation protein B (plasmid) [Pseudorhodobacter turbinis]|uniref:Disulfide bond formation protein B n=1 Tax=Pseudorhodobacter turbinis TaxID=2500533 RepID=A0A4P8EIU0_9RHOB|nr:disulfide bond formation protein B [Pseudorhodobacter turbinis]QCO57071.1 disulfide bond formation protein B [Pseudorhodobacter turbinis]
MSQRNKLVFLAAAGSAGLLLGAFGFQYIGGMFPCELCLLQRWPHAAAIAIGVFALFCGARLLPYLGALAALASAGVALFHTGVERAWWEGLASCSGGSLGGLSVDDLLNPSVVIAAPVRCDAVAWEMFGLSMASWNGILSVVLALVWLAAARKDAA